MPTKFDTSPSGAYGTHVKDIYEGFNLMDMPTFGTGTQVHVLIADSTTRYVMHKYCSGCEADKHLHGKTVEVFIREVKSGA